MENFIFCEFVTEGSQGRTLQHSYSYFFPVTKSVVIIIIGQLDNFAKY